jgi:hypothetical protein
MGNTKLNQVSIGNYGNYSSDNYGSSRYVTIGSLTLYFSYKTVIAFENISGLTICQNDWGTTTGKHLNSISTDKSKRIPYAQFKELLDKVLEIHGLAI